VLALATGLGFAFAIAALLQGRMSGWLLVAVLVSVALAFDLILLGASRQLLTELEDLSPQARGSGFFPGWHYWAAKVERGFATLVALSLQYLVPIGIVLLALEAFGDVSVQ
jgi:hypothetical protein